MKFSDIREGIQQAWQFLLPPFVNLFVVASLTYYIAPDIFSRLFASATLLNFSFLRDESFQKFVEFYGVSKLAPIFLVIAMVFTLYVVDGVVRNVGHMLPGRIVDFGEARLAHVLFLLPGRFAELWAKFPDVADEYRLIQLLRQSLNGLDAQLASNIQHWEKQIGGYYKFGSALKFYLFWCLILILVLLGARQPVGSALVRVVLIGLLILIVLIVLFIKQIYAIEQKAFSELAAIENVLYADESLDRFPSKELVSQMRTRVGESKGKQQVVWWEFRLFDTYQFKWVYRTFIKRTDS